MVASFDDVRRLESEELRALLAHGEGIERVWAAWALALRVGSARPDIVGHVAGEPHPGVRRALLAVLASHGEVEILLALARRDPDDDVRCHAIQYVTRLAAGGAIPLAVVHEAFAEANQRVRREIIVSIPDGAPASLRQLVDHALAAGEPGGFEAVISSGDRNLRLRALAWLHASGSNDHWAYLRAYPPADLVELAAEMDRDLRDRVLAQITSIPIAKLAVLATDLGCYCTMRSRDDFHCAPSDVLARGILAGCAYGYLDAFAGACDELSHELVEPLRDYIETRLAMLDADEPMLDDEEPRYQWTPEDHYQQALQRLR